MSIHKVLILTSCSGYCVAVAKLHVCIKVAAVVVIVYNYVIIIYIIHIS